MSFNVALAQQAASYYRFARPVKHGTDWISPFAAQTPHDPNSPEFKKITIADEHGVLKERYFKIIDTAAFLDPIDLDAWPTTAGGVRDMRVVSCCHTAMKVDSLVSTFAVKDKCPCCRKEHFINELSDPIPAPPAPPAHHIPPHFLHIPPLAPAPPVGVLSPLFNRVARVFALIGFFSFIPNLASLVFTSRLKNYNFTGFGVTFLSFGITLTLVALARLNPLDTLTVKIRNIASPLIKGAFYTGTGATLLAVVKYSLLSSLLVGTGAAVTTLALAVLYAQFMR